MSCVFIRPVLPHGYLPSTDWDYPNATNYDSCDTWGTADIVDADQLQQNWAIIFAKANGLLDGTDFLSTSGQFDEETSLVDYEGGSAGNWPTKGQRHSHDGIDSAKLADHCINQSVLGVGDTATGSFGMIRHPSENYHGILITTHAAYDQPAPGGSETYTADVAIPYNQIQWGRNRLKRQNTGGRTAVLMCPVLSGYSGWSQDEKCAAGVMSAEISLSGDEITSVSAKLNNIMGERVETGWTYGVLVLACLDIP